MSDGQPDSVNLAGTSIEDIDTELHGKTGYRLLVPISNHMGDEAIRQLLSTADAIAEGNGGLLFLLGLVEQSSTEEKDGEPGEENVNPRSDVEEFRARIAELGTPLDSDRVASTVLTHSPEEYQDVILWAVERYDCDGVLLRFHRERPAIERLLLGDIAENVMSNAACDVFAYSSPPQPPTIDRILLAVAGGPHSRIATETTRWIATATAAEVSVIHVVSPNASQSDRAEADRLLDAADEILADVSEVSTIVEADDVGEQILGMSDAYDLTVLGAPTTSLLRRAVFRSVPYRIANSGDPPLLIVKQHGDGDRL